MDISILPVTTEWMSLESLNYVAECLESCTDISMVHDLREIFPREALVAATERVSPAQRRRLRAWVIELNQQADTKFALGGALTK